MLLFSVMLTRRVDSAPNRGTRSEQARAIGAAIAVFSVIATAIYRSKQTAHAVASDLQGIEALGQGIVQNMALPFGLLAVLLFSGIFGARAILRKDVE